MTAIATLSISDLNTSVNHEPRVAHQRLAQSLGLSRSSHLAELVERNSEELKRYGEVCRIARQITSKGGRPGKTYWLNEPQAILITIRSDAPKAPDVREALIDVFMAYRRGELQKSLPAPAPRRDTPNMGQIAQLYTDLKHLQDENTMLKGWVNQLVYRG